MLSRLAGGAGPGVVFLVLVLVLSTYDVVGPQALATAGDLVESVDRHRSADRGDDRVPEGPGGESLTEGVDWALIEPEQGLVRWPCNEAIPVVLVGPAPDGAAAALGTVVDQLSGLSGLPLTVGSPEPRDDGQAWDEGRVLVRYVDPAVRQAPDISFGADAAIGRGGPATEGSRIIAGRLAIRTDSASTDPSAATGRAVLLHEMGHVIGAGHSHGGGGVMTESGADTEPSAGDRYIFRLLGCPR